MAYPVDLKKVKSIRSDAGTIVSAANLVVLEIPAIAAVVADTAGVKTAVTSTASTSVVTTGIVNPAWPRALTATAGGTAGDIKAIQVIVEGTNAAGDVITETLPAFTVDTAGTVQGNKAFATITKITIPAHDGTGATTAIGFNEKLGIPFKLSRNSVIAAYRSSAKEGTAPAVVINASALESNTIDLSSALNGTVVHVELLV
ncbi:hypothetical protein BK133_11210 [Paenibacillus sp. FSL H8-0548]|uniref:hypothetical protein n=1 Tax=Paenibacillus sp. FSL H8-0548 TaxID=1920422 RepID=UPI00096C1694|nr:hypothetical protein [Paenibacillus sp. FSL H8-0548]OMF35268.1 hypothetical protein BK133_11210 [Paenibacillus sp. FSL H8-0548]